MAERQSIEIFTPKYKGATNQHYVPRFYLAGFCRDGLMSVYDRKKKEYRKQSPNGTAAERYYYAFTDGEGKRRFDLEYMLSEYEGKAAGVVAKLAAKKMVSDDERGDMAVFVGLMAMRTPDQIESFRAAHSQMIGLLSKKIFATLEQTKAVMRSHPDNAGKSEAELDTEACKLYEFVKGGRYTIETHKQWALASSITMFGQIAEILVQRDWMVLHIDCDRRSFITSDSPLILTSMRRRPKSSFWGIGYGNEDALVILPLTQKAVLVMSGRGAGLTHGLVSGDHVIRETNLMVADRCMRFVMGRDEDLVRSIVTRLNLEERPWTPKIKVG